MANVLKAWLLILQLAVANISTIANAAIRFVAGIVIAIAIILGLGLGSG